VDGNGNALVYDGHSWSPDVSIDPGTSFLIHQLAAVSCPSTGFCAAVDAGGQVFTYTGGALTVPKAATRTLFKLSAPKLKYGHEQSERFSIVVSSQSSVSIPSGNVEVRAAGRLLCEIKLVSGKGACRL